MSIQILDTVDGIITIEVSGRINPQELSANQAEVLKLLQDWGGGSLLTILEQFEGFEDGGDWSDLSFQVHADPLIRKMALLGDTKWEQFASAFTGKGIRMIEALRWLKS